MIRWWALWRRVQYGIGFLLVLALIGTGIYYAYWYKAPTCFDETQNGEERGVDCGGICKRVCEFEITPPKALWTEAFKIIDGQYNVVAYIENRNTSVGSPALKYTFKLYDAAGVIIERTGTTVLPPDSTYPIFEGRVMTGDRVPTRTTIEFASDAVWLPGEFGREQFTLERRELTNADSKPRLTAQLRNNALAEARNVEVVATIFDISGNPLTSASTFVDYFGGRTTQPVTFTWPQPIAKTVKSCEVPTDVVLAIDLSGSMNNDGKNPPEPITAVLAAAKSFVAHAKENDQIGVVTYATNAVLAQELTHDNGRVSTVVSKLSIDPKEEQGSTNIGDAVKRMQEELSSERHSENARKVAIIITDGLATAPEKDPEIYAEDAATAIKALGVQVFTIGLGKDLNEAFLKKLASTESQYYNAPTSKDLNAIYASITKAICEEGAAVIEIIPKPQTTFVPLQQS